MQRNITPDPIIAEMRETHGKLPAHSFSGFYPYFYLDSYNCVLCPDCANDNDEDIFPIVAVDTNWENPELYCNECGNRIESAYAED